VALAQIIYRIIKTPRLYKEQYSVILVILLGCVIGNGIFLIQNDVLDLSVIVYGFAGVLIYYFAVDFLPHKLKLDMGTMILTKMNSAFIFFDMDGNCIFANNMASSLFKYHSKGNSLKNFLKIIGDDNLSADNQRILEIKGEKGTMYFLMGYQRFNDNRQRYLGCFFRLDDVTEETKEQERQMYLATHDSLTGVYNEDTFYREARIAIDNNPQTPYSLATTNIYQFKLMNDILGKEVGDQLLKDIAMIIDSFNGPGIIYGRLESDKFAICSPSNLKLVELIQNKIDEHLAELRKNKNISLVIFNQCGVYEIQERNISISTMCDRATMALYATKGDVEHKINYYTTELFNRMVLENELLAEMPKALKEKQFVIYFQPQVDSRTGKIVGAEALVRWKHPQKGMIPPGVFIPLLERTGNIYELDCYVWAAACQAAKKLHDLGYDVPLSVNISPRDIYSADICQVIFGLVDKHKIEPRNLNLEVTESAVIKDLTRMNNIISRFREKGFHIEMDDFGSGYSSLNTLKDIQVDVLKLDMRFLDSIKGSERGEKILAAIIALAKSIEAPTIAEGVEDKETVDFLARLGCHNLQGYFYSKPIPYDDLLKMLDSYEIGALE
jgi:diguanylate cyclase (GGDEF)-like protein